MLRIGVARPLVTSRAVVAATRLQSTEAIVCRQCRGVGGCLGARLNTELAPPSHPGYPFGARQHLIFLYDGECKEVVREMLVPRTAIPHKRPSIEHFENMMSFGNKHHAKRFRRHMRKWRYIPEFVDIHSRDFDAGTYGVARANLERNIAVVYPNGAVVSGPEAVRLMYYSTRTKFARIIPQIPFVGDLYSGWLNIAANEQLQMRYFRQPSFEANAFNNGGHYEYYSRYVEGKLSMAKAAQEVAREKISVVQQRMQQRLDANRQHWSQGGDRDRNRDASLHAAIVSLGTVVQRVFAPLISATGSLSTLGRVTVGPRIANNGAGTLDLRGVLNMFGVPHWGPATAAASETAESWATPKREASSVAGASSSGAAAVTAGSSSTETLYPRVDALAHDPAKQVLRQAQREASLQGDADIQGHTSPHEHFRSASEAVVRAEHSSADPLHVRVKKPEAAKEANLSSASTRKERQAAAAGSAEAQGHQSAYEGHRSQSEEVVRAERADAPTPTASTSTATTSTPSASTGANATRKEKEAAKAGSSEAQGHQSPYEGHRSQSEEIVRAERNETSGAATIMQATPAPDATRAPQADASKRGKASYVISKASDGYRFSLMSPTGTVLFTSGSVGSRDEANAAISGLRAAAGDLSGAAKVVKLPEGFVLSFTDPTSGVETRSRAYASKSSLQKALKGVGAHVGAAGVSDSS